MSGNRDVRPQELAVSISDVEYRYPDGTEALKGFTMGVGSGRVVAVVGPSGCGKTTMLYLLAGLAQPAAGQIVWNLPGSSRQPLTMVFQKDTLLPWLTVSENVGFFFRIHRIKTKETRERIEWLLSLVGLGDRADAYPYQLSGGMRRRVAFLAAVAPMPSVLLLDEPFSGLDEPTRVGIHQDVLRIVEELGTTVILVTHDIAEAISLSDEIVLVSARPGHVAARYTVGFGSGRKVMELRERREFLELYGSLWHDLSRQIEKRPMDEGAAGDPPKLPGDAGSIK